jgi:hypothetical protein
VFRLRGAFSTQCTNHAQRMMVCSVIIDTYTMRSCNTLVSPSLIRATSSHSQQGLDAPPVRCPRKLPPGMKTRLGVERGTHKQRGASSRRDILRRCSSDEIGEPFAHDNHCDTWRTRAGQPPPSSTATHVDVMARYHTKLPTELLSPSSNLYGQASQSCAN